jgi:putative addiction module component (TIGR02574 family)
VDATTRRVLRAALQLPARDRADIAGILLWTLDTREDPNVEAAWAAEVERRIADMDSGKVKLEAWNRARRRLRAAMKETAERPPRHSG